MCLMSQIQEIQFWSPEFMVLSHIHIRVRSQRHIPKGDFPSDDSPNGNFPNMQFPKRQLPKGQIRPAEAPQAAMGAKGCSQDGLGGRSPQIEQAGGLLLRLGQNWEVAAWEITHLGSCHWEKTHGKLPLGKNPLGKYLKVK